MTAKVDIDDRLVDVGTDKTNREVGDLHFVHEVSTKRSVSELNDDPKEYMYRIVPILPHVRRYQTAYAKRQKRNEH